MIRPRCLVAPVLVFAAVLPFAGCRGESDPWAGSAGPKVVASFAPITSLARAVAGPDATVKPVMTAQGPHTFEVTHAEAGVVRGADLFLINGLGLDDKIAKKLQESAGGKPLKLVSLGSLVPERDLEVADHDHEAHAGHKHDHKSDPHVWLGLAHAVTYANGIRDELKALDPAHAAGYDARAASTVAALEKLKADGVAAFKPKKEKRFVSFHESLTYFALTFDLEIAAVIQPDPGSEPTAAMMEKLVKTCVEEKVRVIAVEPQFSASQSAERLKDELTRRGLKDVVLVVVDPLETADPTELNAGWYEAKMRANIDALAAALK